MTAPFAKTVTLVRRTKGAPDALGNDTWTEATEDVRCIHAPGSSSEQVQGRDTLTVTTQIYLMPGSLLAHVDAVILDGHRWEVNGDAIDWVSPLTGWRPGVEVPLRRAVG